MDTRPASGATLARNDGTPDPKAERTVCVSSSVNSAALSRRRSASWSVTEQERDLVEFVDDGHLVRRSHVVLNAGAQLGLWEARALTVSSAPRRRSRSPRVSTCTVGRRHGGSSPRRQDRASAPRRLDAPSYHRQ